MTENSSSFYEFGPFRLDSVERRLMRDGREVALGDNDRIERLPPKAFDILLALVEQRGHMLGRLELLEQIWPGTYVEDNRLTDNISLLRKFLGDTARSSRYIQTIPKRGYRFIGEVREVHGGPVAVLERARAHIVVEEDSEPEGATGASVQNSARAQTLTAAATAGSRTQRSRLSLALACTLLALGVFLASYYLIKSRIGSDTAADVTVSPVKSLAVLPFRPLVAERADSALELGMTDALITRLSNIRGLTVRPTSAVLKYTGGDRNVQSIGSELGVDAVLEGRVQKAGDQIRLSVQLLRASDGVTLWAGTFDERLVDLFTAQDSVSSRAAEVLAARLSGKEKEQLTKTYTRSSEAYELYLKGRYFWNKRSVDELRRALQYFEQAAEKDPDFALAYAGQADSYLLLGLKQALNTREAIAGARRAATHALAIDYTLAEAHTSLARVEEYDGHWSDSEREYVRAIEFNPNYATARNWYARFLMRRGRCEEALVQAEKALELDSLSLTFNMSAGEISFYARRYSQAITRLRKTQELDPNYEARQVNYYLYASHAESEKHEEAIPFMAAILAQSDAVKRTDIEAAFKEAFRSGGKEALWQKQIEAIRRNSPPDDDLSMPLAQAYTRLGRKDEALRWLHKSADKLNWAIFFIEHDPTFDSLRSEPRYAELLRKLGIR